jgi:GAF domain-containing protein
MLNAPIPADEASRLAVVRSFDILDTPSEAEFDDLAELASLICGTPVALMTVLDERRQWFKSRIGFDAVETARNISFCGHAIAQDALFEVPDALLDARFADNPLVSGAAPVRFYAGAPLVAQGGFRLGTLCVIDHVPRH